MSHIICQNVTNHQSHPLSKRDSWTVLQLWPASLYLSCFYCLSFALSVCLYSPCSLSFTLSPSLLFLLCLCLSFALSVCLYLPCSLSFTLSPSRSPFLPFILSLRSVFDTPSLFLSLSVYPCLTLSLSSFFHSNYLCLPLLWDQFMTQMKKKVSQCNDQC